MNHEKPTYEDLIETIASQQSEIAGLKAELEKEWIKAGDASEKCEAIKDERDAATARATEAEAACAAMREAIKDLSEIAISGNRSGVSAEVRISLMKQRESVVAAALATTPAEHLAKLQADAKRLEQRVSDLRDALVKIRDASPSVAIAEATAKVALGFDDFAATKETR